MRTPHTVLCSLCGNSVPARTAREKITCWPLPFSGKGTMTSPEKIQRSGEYACPKCFKESREPQREALFR